MGYPFLLRLIGALSRSESELSSISRDAAVWVVMRTDLAEIFVSLML